ncbi:hypothetical protein BGZ57DRAFT_777861, partial [Hyaloscypha finlandica]
FVLLDYFKRVINKENIKIKLGIIDRAYTKAKKLSYLVNKIIKEAKRTFSTLVLIGKTSIIKGLLNKGLIDNYLPLSRNPKYNIILLRNRETLF